MNDRKSSLPDESGQDKGGGAPVSLSRRRFAKGAAPVVLGTLVSKPVLGAGYICTVSGHASGNASAHLMGIDCNSGDDPDTWSANLLWPSPYVSGALPNATDCSFPDSARGTLFNGPPIEGQTLAPTFYYSTSGGCAVGTTSGVGFEPASLLQILNSSDTSELFRLGKATIASLLNIAQDDGYPVSAARVIIMFNAVKDDGVYVVPAVNLNLTRLGVIRYLEKLYTPSG